MIKFILITLQILFIVRFHLEISNVNAHMQPARTLRKITNPVVMPLKNLLPLAAKPFAAILVAYFIALVILFIFAASIGFFNVFIQAFLWLVTSWLLFFQYGLFLYMIGSFIRIPELQRANYFLHQLFEPVLRPIRRVLPPFGGLDFSPLVLLIGLYLVTGLLGL